jgi:hypothetical protein
MSDTTIRMLLRELGNLAERWQREAADGAKSADLYRRDQNDQLAAWLNAVADTSHWHAASVREIVTHYSGRAITRCTGVRR